MTCRLVFQLCEVVLDDRVDFTLKILHLVSFISFITSRDMKLALLSWRPEENVISELEEALLMRHNDILAEIVKQR